jgi:hypothetical protein
MRRLLARSVIILAVGLITIAVASPALAEPPQVIQLEGFLTQNNCGIEDMSITGTLFRFIGESDGGEPFRSLVQYANVSGVGLVTGTQYSINFTVRDVFKVGDPGETIVSHSVGIFTIVSRGAGTNYRLTGHVHLIYLPDGTLNEIFFFTEACQ